MGKIKITTLGTDEEEQLKEKEKVKREQKKLREGVARRSLEDKKSEGLARRSLGEGGKKEDLEEGSRNVVLEPKEVAPVEEKTEKKIKSADNDPSLRASAKQSSKVVKEALPKHHKSKKYLKSKENVDKTKLYRLADAIALVKKTSYSKFDGSVEAHINTIEKGVKATLTYPHKTGKSVKVVVINDDVLGEIDKGQINFDVLVATPDFMPRLAKYAKVLGPKGLMPNPKNGTVTTDTKAALKKYEAGELNLKTEGDSAVIHTVLGKVSFDNKALEENLKTLLLAIGTAKIQTAFIKPTMGPAIKVDLASL